MVESPPKIRPSPHRTREPTWVAGAPALGLPPCCSSDKAPLPLLLQVPHSGLLPSPLSGTIPDSSQNSLQDMLPYLLSSKQTKSLSSPMLPLASQPHSLLPSQQELLETSHISFSSSAPVVLASVPTAPQNCICQGLSHPALPILMGTQPWSYQVSQSIWETQALPHALCPETHLPGHADAPPASGAPSHHFSHPLLFGPASEVGVPGF